MSFVKTDVILTFSNVIGEYSVARQLDSIDSVTSRSCTGLRLSFVRVSGLVKLLNLTADRRGAV